MLKFRLNFESWSLNLLTWVPMLTWGWTRVPRVRTPGSNSVWELHVPTPLQPSKSLNRVRTCKNPCSDRRDTKTVSFFQPLANKVSVLLLNFCTSRSTGSSAEKADRGSNSHSFLNKPSWEKLERIYPNSPSFLLFFEFLCHNSKKKKVENDKRNLSLVERLGGELLPQESWWNKIDVNSPLVFLPLKFEKREQTMRGKGGCVISSSGPLVLLDGAGFVI